MRPLRLFTALLLVLASAAVARADEKIRPRSFEEIPIEVWQEHLRVPGARIAWVNYPAIRRDFPELRSASEARIDQWVLENYARISLAQLGLRGIRSTDFAVDPADASRLGHPRDYNRAVMADSVLDGIRLQGLVDLKGSGFRERMSTLWQIEEYRSILNDSRLSAQRRTELLNKLLTTDHSDGLMSLGEGLAEITRQLAIQRAFDIHNAEHGTAYETVENYFLVDLGFDILKDHGQAVRAAVIGRQANWRGGSELPVPPSIYVDTRGARQATIFDSAVDFGGVTITDSRLRQEFGTPVAIPGKRAWDGGPLYDPQVSVPWARGHEVARAFQDKAWHDEAHARAEVDAHIAEMLSPLDEPHARAVGALGPRESYLRYLGSRLHSRSDEGQYRAKARLLELEPEERDRVNACALRFGRMGILGASVPSP